MSTTEAYLAEIHRAPDCQAGRLTLAQVWEISQSVSNVATVCAHAIHGRDIHPQYPARIDALRDNGSLSIAQARAVLDAWRKWTSWRDNGSETPTLSQVCNFLCSESVDKLLK